MLERYHESLKVADEASIQELLTVTKPGHLEFDEKEEGKLQATAASSEVLSTRTNSIESLSPNQS